MVLVDAYQIAIATIMAEAKGSPIADIDLMRHMFLVSIKNIRKKFKNEGELVLCWDAGNYWRRDIFEHYKAKRKKQREESGVDWNTIFEHIKTIRKEIDGVFPYKNLKVEKCEADDVIAVLSRQYNGIEPIVIVSSDEDFLQLQIYPSVKQWNPFKSKWVKTENPKEFLIRKIMSGDTGDGVPNFLSDGDTFVTEGKRQKSLLEKNVVKWLTHPLNTVCDERMLENYARNEALISLFKIPQKFCDAILEEYEKPVEGNRTKVLDYLMKNRMKLLIEDLEEF